MGWKSTIDIHRSEAISVILEAINQKAYHSMSNSELEDEMYRLGIGDDTDKPYFGHNFNIHDDDVDLTEY